MNYLKKKKQNNLLFIYIYIYIFIFLFIFYLFELLKEKFFKFYPCAILIFTNTPSFLRELWVLLLKLNSIFSYAWHIVRTDLTYACLLAKFVRSFLTPERRISYINRCKMQLNTDQNEAFQHSRNQSILYVSRNIKKNFI